MSLYFEAGFVGLGVYQIEGTCECCAGFAQMQ